MCGFLAYYSITEIDDQKFKNACSKLNHRGPDSEGYWFSDDKKKLLDLKDYQLLTQILIQTSQCLMKKKKILFYLMGKFIII